MKRMLCLLLPLLCMTAHAKPAPWHQWKSRLTGEIICVQSFPGNGWVQVSGPYTNPQCKHNWPDTKQ